MSQTPSKVAKGLEKVTNRASFCRLRLTVYVSRLCQTKHVGAGALTRPAMRSIAIESPDLHQAAKKSRDHVIAGTIPGQAPCDSVEEPRF